MYESPHPPHAVKASDAPAHIPGIDFSGIDWTVWAVAAATIAIMAFILLKGRNRRGLRGTAASDPNGVADALLLSQMSSWGPGDHSRSGSDGGHHGGFFDGSGGDAGGGCH